jgi:hypothetical protein
LQRLSDVVAGAFGERGDLLSAGQFEETRDAFSEIATDLVGRCERLIRLRAHPTEPPRRHRTGIGFDRACHAERPHRQAVEVVLIHAGVDLIELDHRAVVWE